MVKNFRMKKIEIEINDDIYIVSLALTDEERATGLQNRSHLPDHRGMIFPYEEPSEVGFWMKDTHIPLQIIFIDEDWNVIRVAEGEPLSENLIREEGVAYVLELNMNAQVEKGDYVDLDKVEEYLMDLEFFYDEPDDEVIKMLVLDHKGRVQMELDGGERIFSRKNTKTLISMAKRAKRSKLTNDYKRLGSKIFSYLKIQDDKEPDYVSLPDK